jgi:glutamate-1-semialdehyde aminotransferase
VLEQRARGLLATLATTAHQLGCRSAVMPPARCSAGISSTEPFTTSRPRRAPTVSCSRRFHRASLDRGVFLPASPFEASFLSIAHTQDLIDDTAERLSDALREAAQ